MDPIKEAFLKIKEEILNLKNEIKSIKEQLSYQQTYNNQTIPTQDISFSTQQTPQQTDNQTHSSKNNMVEAPYNQNYDVSIGNKGVPTDTHTNQQTPQQTENKNIINYKSDFKQAKDILDSLDYIKKEIRLKFKRLTSQEMVVFSHLYTLEEQKIEEITYKTIALKMKLSESSIRDYINKLIIKGIPIEKSRKNNKTIILNISKDLKNIASLSVIQNLREI